MQKLVDSERRVVECLWEHGDLPAKEIAKYLATQVGWSKTTTYTIIGRCVEKGAVSRSDPGFVCHALLTKDSVCQQETDDLIERNYGGSADLLVASLLGRKKLSKADLERMRALIEELE